MDSFLVFFTDTCNKVLSLGPLYTHIEMENVYTKHFGEMIYDTFLKSELYGKFLALIVYIFYLEMGCFSLNKKIQSLSVY